MIEKEETETEIENSRERQRQKDKFEDSKLLTLRMEQGARSQGITDDLQELEKERTVILS